jgi:hypothetical protein
LSNIRGKAYAMNVITPMRRWKSPILKAAFKLFTVKVTQWELRRLSFIHFARWTSISCANMAHFPEMKKRESFGYDYLLFESNFNGSWNEYVDAFHSVLAFKLNLVWMWSENYPGSIPLVPFKNYIEHNQLYNDYYYMAYPGSTVSDVKNAVDVSCAFQDLTKSLDASDEAFASAYRAFLYKVQNKLGSNGGAGPRMS